MASDEQFSLCWNNFHANMSAGFHGLLSRGDLVDVTLAAEGRLLQAHKLVLSVCSPFFQEMFKMNPTQHPIVFLKDVSHSALRDLLQFMYQGEVNVKQEELASFISTAEQLQVKGLTGNQNEESSTPSKPKPTSRPGPRSSQQRQSVMTKLETDIDSKPSSTPVAVKRPNRPSIASNNSSSSQSGPVKRKCVDPLEAGPSGSAKEEFVTIPDEDENNAVAPKMEPEFVNESMWDDDDDGTNNDDTNFGEDDSNMEMTGFDGSATGDGNITGGGEGAVGDAQVFSDRDIVPAKDDIIAELLNSTFLMKEELGRKVILEEPKAHTLAEQKAYEYVISTQKYSEYILTKHKSPEPIPVLRLPEPISEMVSSPVLPKRKAPETAVSKPKVPKFVYGIPKPRTSNTMVPRLKALEPIPVSKQKIRKPMPSKSNTPDSAASAPNAPTYIEPPQNLQKYVEPTQNAPELMVTQELPAVLQLKSDVTQETAVPIPVFAKNSAGFPMIVIGNDRFYKGGSRKSNSDKIRWICRLSRKNKCRATVVTRHGTIISTANEHNHTS